MLSVSRILLAASIAACGGSPQPSKQTPPPSSMEPPASTREGEVDAGTTPPAEPTASASATPASDDPTAAQATAKKDGKATLLVFCAKWVAACSELSNVLADSSVQRILNERFVVARVDATNEDDPTTVERVKRYNVKGLPSMIVFDRKGKEVGRENGYLDANRLAKLLERAK